MVLFYRVPTDKKKEHIKRPMVSRGDVVADEFHVN